MPGTTSKSRKSIKTLIYQQFRHGPLNNIHAASVTWHLAIFLHHTEKLSTVKNEIDLFQTAPFQVIQRAEIYRH